MNLAKDLISKRSKLLQEFKLPSNIYAIALDDSKIQRKLLARYFTFAGIPEDRIQVLGGSAQEIKEFDEWAYTFIVKHPDDYILFIVDENLDVHDNEITATKEGTISGSLSVNKFRKRLSSDQESRILTLIRSANDSGNDLAVYTSRAHGFLPKSPIMPSRTLEELAPLWLDRFSSSTALNHVNSKHLFPKLYNDSTEVETASRDLLESVAKIDSIIVNEQNRSSSDWAIIWEKLHSLKGDLLTFPNENKCDFSLEIETISSMRGSTVPPALAEKWEHINKKITSSLS